MSEKIAWNNNLNTLYANDLVGWLLFYSISTLIGYLMPNTALIELIFKPVLMYLNVFSY